jgi:branched-chain amino acid transport system substrate-binding protein
VRASSRTLSLLTAGVAIASIIGGCSSSAATPTTAAVATGTAVVGTSASAPASAAASVYPTADASNPINVGEVATLSGGIPFVALPPGVQAYFDYINSMGGVQGRKLVLNTLDDGGSPTEAAADAKKLILENNVVAMVGNVSLVDCSTNEKYYEQQGIVTDGLGPEPDCYGLKNYFVVEPGPYVGTRIILSYAYKTLGLKNMCLIGQNDPASIDGYKQIVSDFETANSVTMPLVEFTNDTSQSPTPEVVQAKNAGCDGIVTQTMPSNFVAFVQAAKTAGFDGTMFCVGSAYDSTVPPALGATAEPGALGSNSQGIFVLSELAPFTGTLGAGLQTYAEWLQKDKLSANYWTEAGWFSAEVFVHVLQTISGPITRDSVTKAYETMQPYTSAFAGSPLQFGTANESSIMMSIKNGAWVTVSNWLFASQS